MHEVQQSDEESWHNVHVENYRQHLSSSYKVLVLKSIRSVIVTKLETSSGQKTTKVEYKIDRGSDGN